MNADENQNIVPESNPGVAASSQAPSTNPTIQSSPVNPTINTPPSKSHKKLLIVLAVVLVVILVGGGAYALYRHNHKVKPVATSNTSTETKTTTKSSSATTATTTPASDVCFLVSAKNTLDCVNDTGNDPTSYTIPQYGGDNAGFIVPNANDTEYVYDNGSLWILNNKFAEVKSITLPPNTSYNPGTTSWSHDGQTLYMELSNSAPSEQNRQIYSYQISTGKFTQLTTGNNNTQPYGTENGDIIYTHFTGQGTDGWMPYIMNSDGSNQKPLTSLAPNFAGLSYDSATDTILVDNYPSDSSSTTGTLNYETVSDFLNGTSPTSINLAYVQGSGNGLVAIVNSSTVIWSPDTPDARTNPTLQFINLTNGQVENTISDPGSVVGVLPNIAQAQ